MARVHRGKTRPQTMRWKTSILFQDFAFNENKLVDWAKKHLDGTMSYNIIVFHKSNTRFVKQIEFTAWFAKKTDYEAFNKEWVA